MTNNFGDTGLSLKSQALAVMHHLAAMEPDFAPYEDGYYQCRISSFAFYNGRERGCGVEIRTPRANSLDSLFIVWSEHRSSDCIVIYHWVGMSQINPPTVDDIPEESWDKADMIDWGKTGFAAQLIFRTAKDWWEAEKAKDEQEAASVHA